MMDFHIGKIYKLPNNFYFYKANQPRLLIEYCKQKLKSNNSSKEYNYKILDTEYHIQFSEKILETNSSCLEYCKNIMNSNNDESLIIESDDDSWVDMKKFL